MPRPRGGNNGSGRDTATSKKPSSLVIPTLLIATLLAAIGFGWHKANQSRVPTDPLTLCATQQGPGAVHVILIDVTDQLSALAQEEIFQEVERIQAKVERLDRLEIYGLGPDDDGITAPLFAACNPGRGKDMNALYQNPQLAEARWQKEFQIKLGNALGTIVSKEESQRSPILEAIRRISVKTFGQPQYDSSKKHLYVFSDLLQHNPGIYSHYNRPLQRYEAFLADGKHPSAQANLTGVAVEFFYLSPPQVRKLQNAEHFRFWESYVEKSGGTFGPRPITRILGGE